MAYTRIHAIKTTLNKALDYIENPAQTQEQLLVSGYNVDPISASVEYRMTAALAREMKGDYAKTGGTDILAFHMIQSFSPYDKITPEQAHEIGKKWADEILQGKHEYVISTHVDKGHIHNHIIFNSVSFYDYKKYEIIPVIYIKNEVFLENNVSSEFLAQQIDKYIKQINKTYDISVNEIQFDCDWTLKSKEKYFEFINFFKENNSYSLSATIRLHQIKYFSTTGVPPVNYGVLMYYNMGNISAIGKNSIYDRETAKQYLSSLKNYPLELNIALPLFSWGVHSIGGEVINLVAGLTSKEIKTIKGIEQIGENNIFLVTKQVNYKGRIWQKGDIIKIEEISENELLTMKNDILKNIKKSPKEIILYDLNKNIINYENKFFKNLR